MISHSSAASTSWLFASRLCKGIVLIALLPACGSSGGEAFDRDIGGASHGECATTTSAKDSRDSSIPQMTLSREDYFTPIPRETVIDLIDEALLRLAQPLTEADRHDGWNPQLQSFADETLRDIRDRLQDPRPLELDEVRPSLARDFDDSGVHGGDLLNEISRISIHVNALAECGG